MNLEITDQAIEWYKNEYEIKEDTMLRLFVRYGGVGGLIPGFSLGISLESPDEIHIKKTAGNLTFYIEEKDTWYFEDKNLYIGFNEDLHEPEFIYE